MDSNISLRKAEISDIEAIKAILFSSLKEYKIAMPDNYKIYHTILIAYSWTGFGTQAG